MVKVGFVLFCFALVDEGEQILAITVPRVPAQGYGTVNRRICGISLGGWVVIR